MLKLLYHRPKNSQIRNTVIWYASQCRDTFHIHVECCKQHSCFYLLMGFWLSMLVLWYCPLTLEARRRKHVVLSSRSIHWILDAFLFILFTFWIPFIEFHIFVYNLTGLWFERCMFKFCRMTCKVLSNNYVIFW